MNDFIRIAFTVFCIIKTTEYIYKVCRWVKKKEK